jgi:prepilin-type N-terminal cleavage/methylation domain-containing protein
MENDQGFTLIEMAVVLAVIAVLAALMTPIATSYIDQSRDTRANNDVRKIAEAVLLFQRDTGRWPAYDGFAAASANTTPSVNCLTTGKTPSLPVGTNDSSWSTNCPGSMRLLSDYVNVNSLAITSANGTGGGISYRGPYLEGTTGVDPWANPYVVTSEWLATTGANAANWAFVVSAGSNMGIDTPFVKPHTGSFSASGDDIVAMIR